MPLGSDLRDMLCNKFLKGECKERSLEEVANYVVNDFGRANLEIFIRDCVKDFKPGPGHLLLPSFRWAAVYSTNYDRLIERAYDSKDRRQTLVPFAYDHAAMDREIKAAVDPLPLYKLHGCIDRLHDKSAPLVLTTDTFVVPMQGRSKMFGRFTDAITEHPVVYVGTNLTDHHIKVIRANTDYLSSERPMHYFISPGLNQYDSALFAHERTTPIKGTFEDFMKSVEECISENERALSAVSPKVTLSIEGNFRHNRTASPELRAFLNENVEHVRAGMPSRAISPMDFFKGDSHSWHPIETSLDIGRPAYDALMLKTLSLQKSETLVNIIAVTGVAGAGKSVFARRVAWDLAAEYGQLVLFAGPQSLIRTDPMLELADSTGLRAILVVDQAADQFSAVSDLVNRFEAQHVPITLILTDTQAAFGTNLDRFGGNLRFRFDLKTLTEREIEDLLANLDKHGCLGDLEKKNADDRKRTFLDLANKQLLVSLYEATHGEPLEDILLEEFHRILLSDAQELYLIVCTLNQFGVPVRAGLVKRLTGVGFEQFEKQLLGPLRGIVHATYDRGALDYCYRSRHRQIAEIVFARVLDSNSQRIGQYMRVLERMDSTYSSDNSALRQLLNYRNLRALSSNLADGRRILQLAEEVMSDDAYVRQQQALLEMNSPKGDLERARDRLTEAIELAPRDLSIQHTKASLLAREANAASSPIVAKQLRGEARGILAALKSVRWDPYVASLYAQIAIDELGEVIKGVDNAPSPSDEAKILRLISQAEQSISDGLRRTSEFELLTVQSSRLQAIIGEKVKAVSLLARSLKSQPHQEYVAAAYAKAIMNSDMDAAIEAIRGALKSKPTSKLLNQRLFELLVRLADDARDELLTPLRKSYTKDDGNVLMHVHALRFHFLRGESSEYEQAKAVASGLTADKWEKDAARLRFKNKAAEDGRFRGAIDTLRDAYGWVRCGGLLDRVFVRPIVSCDTEAWDSLREGQSVAFDLCFNVKGPIASHLHAKAV